ncbi:MAG: helicase-related protein [Candidatus Micrarchaeia archaeon]|jgi:Fanconi anemia group M protein
MAPFLREGIIPRAYQSAIAASALARGNTLVVLPTGLGKTLVAFLVMEERLKAGRVVFLAPTKPLVRQHHKTFLEMTNFPEEGTALITGEVAPKKREGMWKRKACFSTPQTLQNDLKKGRANAGIALVVVDEAHRAVGSYAYTYVATECAKAGALVLGLTASPGGNKARIEEIVEILGIKNIEIRTAEDPDVLPYMMPLDVTYIRVPLGKSFTSARLLLEEMLHEAADRLSSFGMHVPFRSKRALVELRGRILRMSEKSRYTALSFYATVFNLSHMLELIETQGPAPFLSYVKKMEAREDTKARHRIFADRRFMEAVRICGAAEAHPKLEKLCELLSAPSAKDEKTLVFAQYRDTVKAIVEYLRAKGFSTERFVGKKEGVTAEEQRKTIERFAHGEFSVMAATSIGEEGLDIPSVDTVVFFEPIPSEIRSIQRRGRAGRLRAGKVVVLVAEGTRDEGHLHSSRKKEENMKKIVGRMKRQFAHSQASAPAAADGSLAASGGAPASGASRERKRRKAKEEQKKITDF